MKATTKLPRHGVPISVRIAKPIYEQLVEAQKAADDKSLTNTIERMISQGLMFERMAGGPSMRPALEMLWRTDRQLQLALEQLDSYQQKGIATLEQRARAKELVIARYNAQLEKIGVDTNLMIMNDNVLTEASDNDGSDK